MRHRKIKSRLNRTTEHRAAMLRNLAVALVEHERIRTTKPKADALRPFVESLVTLAKEGSLASKRLAISRLQDRFAVSKLFDQIAPRSKDRPGGYLRIVKDGVRMGDGAAMAFIEFVDAAPGGDETTERPRDRRKLLRQRMHQRRKEMARMRQA
ncbi:MAG TPA: 50S ribosomal protein L17 [Candidatus Sumerlaeota bacterium]|nr:MAG: 50S ribosomal protein L17 [candidate division BRC1 bacterium ADurb.BinA292]HOE96667.1 50S ribosomal protein L17 [Candidatus Sumerlaeota bacterium]HOR27536.1 50S ribosomal protein L17 [Candidatus Sumerlaeota bacterium]HPK02551.1 50S ribosomal protein L17 [Candidatus Sumerlaeota bacterium]